MVLSIAAKAVSTAINVKEAVHDIDKLVEDIISDVTGKIEELSRNLPGFTGIMLKYIPNMDQQLASQAEEYLRQKGGLPDFGKHVIVDIKIPDNVAIIEQERKHMKVATQQLKQLVQQEKINKNIFTPDQIKDIMAGETKIRNFTWHHNEHLGRMQLIPETIHQATGHIGGMKLWPFQEK